MVAEVLTKREDVPDIKDIESAFFALGSLAGEYNIDLGRMRSADGPIKDAFNIGIQVRTGQAGHGTLVANVTLRSHTEETENGYTKSGKYRVSGGPVYPEDTEFSEIPNDFEEQDIQFQNIASNFDDATEAIEKLIELSIFLRNRQFELLEERGEDTV